MTHFPRSEALFERAKQHIPGGVNSPVRAFLSVGGTPPFIRSATGCTMTDADGNVYIDYIGSWGPMILGHNHPAIRQAVVAAAENGLSFGAATEAEVQMAETVCRMMPVLEMVRMVNSGTEAVMSALRAARGFTGRDKVIKFEGCYHGHADAMLVKAGSGVMTAGIPSSSGVPKGCAKDTLTATYNDLASVERLFAENKGEVACIIVEPVAANMGVVLPQKGFLQGLRALCDREGALLIFDEVITGFRLAPGGAAEKYQVRPDLMTFGKIIGAGMPVGAYGGRREVMEVIAPLGSVYQAGTLSGNPIAMAAGLCQLSMLENHPEVYEHIDRLGKMLGDGLRAIADRANIPVWVNQTGSLCSMFFTEQPVVDYESAKTADTARFAQFFHGMLARGIYLGPSQFEAAFVSAAHSESAIAQTLRAAEDVFAEL